MNSILYKRESSLSDIDKALIIQAERKAMAEVDLMRKLYFRDNEWVPPLKTKAGSKDLKPDECVTLESDLEAYQHDLGYMTRKAGSFHLMGRKDAQIPVSLITARLTPLRDGDVITLIGEKGRYPVRIKRQK